MYAMAAPQLATTTAKLTSTKSVFHRLRLKCPQPNGKDTFRDSPLVTQETQVSLNEKSHYEISWRQTGRNSQSELQREVCRVRSLERISLVYLFYPKDKKNNGLRISKLWQQNVMEHSA